jgi:hypothetical protein
MRKWFSTQEHFTAILVIDVPTLVIYIKIFINRIRYVRYVYMYNIM